MLLSANANIRKIEKLKELGYDAIDVGFTRRRAVEELCRRCGYAKRFSKK